MCAIRLNSNTFALRAQRSLDRTSSGLAKVFERLASGQRINRAADDAAGLAIAENLRASVRLYSQAIRNISDGISYISIASGAYDQLANINIRMRELSEQSANGVYSARQREALDNELQELVAEHNRIVSSTSFNGQRILTGGSSGVSLQVGITSETASLLDVDVVAQFARASGTGSFSAPASYGTGGGPLGVLSTDVNGDGRADVVTANGGSGNVSVLLGQADGTLGSASNVGVTDTPSDIAAGDFNGDGRIDLVTADNGGGSGTTATILINDGSGGFTSGGTLAAGTGPLAVATADVNNDGRIDIVTSAAAGGVANQANFGSGTAEVSSVTTPGTGTAEVTQVVAATGGSAGPGVAETTILGMGRGYRLTEMDKPTFNAGVATAPGSYWSFSANGHDHYVWYTVDANGADPFGTPDGIRVDILSSDTNADVAAKTRDAINDPSRPYLSAKLFSATYLEVFGFFEGDFTNFSAGTYGSAPNLFGGGFLDGIDAGSYFELSSPTTDYYVWFAYRATGGIEQGLTEWGVDPMVAGKTGIKVELDHNDAATDVAIKVASALNGVAGTPFAATAGGSNVEVTNTATGIANDAVLGTMNPAYLSINVTEQGAATGGGGGAVKEETYFTLDRGFRLSEMDIVPFDGASTVAGSYYTFNANGNEHYVWFTVNGAGSDPMAAGSGIQVDVLSTDTIALVAQKVVDAINAQSLPYMYSRRLGNFVETYGLFEGDFTSFTSGTYGNAPNLFLSFIDGIDAGSYFEVSSPTTDYYVWFAYQTAFGGPEWGTDPGLAGKTGVKVLLDQNDLIVEVANKVVSALSGVAGAPFSATRVGNDVRVVNSVSGQANDATLGTMTTHLSFAITVQGSDGSGGGGGGGSIATGDYFLLNSPTTQYYVWFNVDDTDDGNSPGISGKTGVEVEILSTDDEAAVASKIKTALDGIAGTPFATTISGAGNDVLTITNNAVGAVADASDFNVGAPFAVSTLTQGTNSSIATGQYFLFSSPGTDYYLWYNVDGGGGNPGGSLPGRTGIQVNVSSGWTATQIATATASAIDALADFSANGTGGSLTITNAASGAVVDISNGNIGAGFSSSVSTQGVNPAVNVAADTITVNAHGFSTGDEVQLSSTGALPGGVSASTNYYVIASDTNTIRLAGSALDAANGIAIDLTSPGSGTQTIQGTSAGAGVRVFINTGSGFDSGSAFNLGQSPIDIALGDIDGDGVQDLVAVDNIQNLVRVARGRGDGSFESAVGYATGAGASSVAIADLNNDGYADVITADRGDSTLSVFFGGAGATLGPRTILAAGSVPNGVSAGDVNGDGIADIVAALAGGQSAVFLNDGRGGFTAGTPVAAGSAPSGVALGDIDGDGVLDIITSNGGDDSVSVGLAVSEQVTTLAAFNIRTRASALHALEMLTTIQERITAQRGVLGASESRLTTTLQVHSASVENHSVAQSRIMDADMSAETSELTRLGILQQAGRAVLAQANVQPALALTLIQA